MEIDQNVVENAVDRGAEHDEREHPDGPRAPFVRQQEQCRGHDEYGQSQPRDQLFEAVPVPFGRQFECGREDTDHGQCDEAASNEDHDRCAPRPERLAHGASAEKECR
jgi:hypothetical protein